MSDGFTFEDHVAYGKMLKCYHECLIDLGVHASKQYGKDSEPALKVDVVINEVNSLRDVLDDLVCLESGRDDCVKCYFGRGFIEEVAK